MNNQKIWFVTGASKGMGLLLTKLLLDKGHKVAATSRSLDSLKKNVGIQNHHFLPIELDITNSDDVKQAIDLTISYFGGLDVAVNNAGFSYIGSLEELTDAEFRTALDVNLFGTVNVIRASMAHFRRHKSGRIINIASAAGYIAGPNIGSYVASKFAIVGLTEALAMESAHLNIKPTVVLPGSFRTNFLGEDSLNYAKDPIDEYQSSNTYKSYAERAGKQPGDPKKLAAELVNLADMENPPVHLILGPDSFKMIMDKRERDLNEFESFKEISLSTDLQ
ncbi:SDR family NAD(P)-dependent oxidoreductase [Flavobacterium sp. ASV13]|uniref:SDR family NAD(P)-dependent oxidoreductase n=1 Tax=Flavobacterium sp. ASV13 TaxID=1506583 RepID=UPI0005587097|nr:SDR family NAD(P)-dependent oxidoreductase [Flavobacterium sp. ASV13]